MGAQLPEAEAGGVAATLAVAPTVAEPAARRRGWTRNLDLIIPGAIVGPPALPVLRVAAVRHGAPADGRQHPRRQRPVVLRRAPPRHRPGRQRPLVAAALRRAQLAGDRVRRQRHRARARRPARGLRRLLGLVRRHRDHARPRRPHRLPVARAGAGDRPEPRAEQAAHDLRAVVLQRPGLRADVAGRDAAPARAAVHARRAAGGHARAADPAAPRRAEHPPPARHLRRCWGWA